jgi:hypothetical protein
MTKKTNNKHLLPLSTIVLVIREHKTTFEKQQKVMTFGEWLQLKKDIKWVYKCLQVVE